MARRRTGIRTEIVVVFALVTVFAVGVNTVVVWGLARLLLVRERASVAEATARYAATLAGSEATVDDGLAVALSIPGVVGVAAYDLAGNTLRHEGDLFGRLERDGDVTSVLLNGSAVTTQVHTTGADARGGVIHAMATVKWRVSTGDLKPPGVVRAVAVASGDPAASARFRTLSLLYVALNALLVAGFGVWLVTRSVVRPMRALASATRRVAAGDLETRAPVGGAVEIAELGDAFNAMITAVAERERELREAHGSLLSAQDEVLQSEKLAGVGRLAAGVAHEMGNPLGAILGYVSMLRADRDEDDQSDEARTVRNIEKEARRLDRIIRELLDYARPRADSPASVAVGPVLAAALSMVRTQKQFKDIEVVESIRDGLPPVFVDEHRLEQVIVNLMINAADAVNGKGRIDIETRMGEFPDLSYTGRRIDDRNYPTGPAVEITVRDNGSGIDPANLASIFEPFFTTKEPGEGTGLGLAICQRIVNAAGGRIEVDSTSEGTTFVVQLPPAKR